MKEEKKKRFKFLNMGFWRLKFPSKDCALQKQ